MSIEIELEAEGAPSGDAKIAQTKLGIDEVEVVVKALAAIRLQECPFGFLVEPRLIGGAGFHGREDVNESRVRTAPSQDFLNSTLLPRSRLSHKLDFDTRLLGESFGILPDLSTVGLGHRA